LRWYSLLRLLPQTISLSQRKLVDLNVIALENHGQPVNSLTSDDFQVNDAGKQQKTAFFRHNDSKLSQAEAQRIIKPHGSQSPHATVILLDLLNEDFGSRPLLRTKGSYVKQTPRLSLLVF